MIFNAEFDAIDSDFSLGNINNLKLYNIGHSGGGDAIDLSGSKVSARDISILDVNDKAISVGENSYFNGNNIVIENSKIGIASKDGSKVVVKGSRIFNSTIAGLMAFSKKDEYSGGEIVFDKGELNNSVDFISQYGSKISIDGIPKANVSLNINELYK